MWLKLCIVAVLFLGAHCDYVDEPFDYEDDVNDYNSTVMDYSTFQEHITDGDANLSLNTLTEATRDSYEDTVNEMESKLHMTTYVPPKFQKNNSRLVSNKIIGKNISLDADVSLKLSNISLKQKELDEADNLTSTTTSIVYKTRPNVNKTKDKGGAEEKTFNSSTASNINSIITTTEIVTTSAPSISETASVITTPVSTNITTSAAVPVPTEDTNNNNQTGLIFKSFNLNYLYFLLLLIPIGGIGIAVLYFSKRRKKEGYEEPTPRTNKTRRFSTPSWVFSEPDFDDEEVITLQEEKK